MLFLINLLEFVAELFVVFKHDAFVLRHGIKEVSVKYCLRIGEAIHSLLTVSLRLSV